MSIRAAKWAPYRCSDRPNRRRYGLHRKIDENLHLYTYLDDGGEWRGGVVRLGVTDVAAELERYGLQPEEPGANYQRKVVGRLAARWILVDGQFSVYCSPCEMGRHAREVAVELARELGLAVTP